MRETGIMCSGTVIIAKAISTEVSGVKMCDSSGVYKKTNHFT